MPKHLNFEVVPLAEVLSKLPIPETLPLPVVLVVDYEYYWEGCDLRDWKFCRDLGEWDYFEVEVFRHWENLYYRR